MRRALAQLQLVGFLLLSAVSAFAQGGVTLRRPTPPTVKRNFVAASVHALPGLHCQLYPAGATPSSGVTVFTDDDGFARFHAFYRSPDAKPTKRPVARPPDYFYLEAETLKCGFFLTGNKRDRRNVLLVGESWQEISQRVFAVIVLSITIVALAGGCNLKYSLVFAWL